MGRTRRRRGRNRKGESSSTEEHATTAATQGTSSSSSTTVEQHVEGAVAAAPVAAAHSGAEPQLPAVYSSIDDEEEDSGVDELLDEYEERMLYEEPEELFESLKLPTTPSDGASGVWRDEVDGVARSKRIIAELQQEVRRGSGMREWGTSFGCVTQFVSCVLQEEEQRCSTACGVMIAMLILYD